MKDIIEILKSKSRDNSRTPVQWKGTKNAGFTTGTPYISVSDNYNEEKLLVVSNFYGKETIFNLPEGLKLKGKSEILLSNYSDTVNNVEKLWLRPYEAVVFYIK